MESCVGLCWSVAGCSVFHRWTASDPRSGRGRNLVRPMASEAGVGGGDFDAVQQQHRRYVDPDEKDHDGGNGAMDIAEARQVAHVPGEAEERPAPEQARDDGPDPHVPEADLRIGHEVEDEAHDRDEDRGAGTADDEMM